MEAHSWNKRYLHHMQVLTKDTDLPGIAKAFSLLSADTSLSVLSCLNHALRLHLHLLGY